MPLKPKAIITALVTFITLLSHGQTSKVPVEYLSVPGPIVLNGDAFNFAWSTHPSPTYYKQEYIGSKDNLEKFKKMVLVEVLFGESKPADLAQAKIAELKKMKETNPIVNYEVFQKNGEIIVDFLLSENSPDGKKINIIERNVYRYKAIVDKGQNGVMLFAVSERAYGDAAADAFLSSLKKTKSVLTNSVAAFALPKISVKK